MVPTASLFLLVPFFFTSYLIEAPIVASIQRELVIDGDEITVGAFSRRRVDLRQVVDTKLQTGRGAELTLVLGNGSKICLSGLLTDFDLMSQTLLGRVSCQK